MPEVQEWLGSHTSAASYDVTGPATNQGAFLHVTVVVRDPDSDASVQGGGNTWIQVPSVGRGGGGNLSIFHFYALSADPVTQITITRSHDGVGSLARLVEFSETVSGLLDHDSADLAAASELPPVEVSFGDDNVVVVGSVAMPVATRVLELQNVGDFTALERQAAQSTAHDAAAGVLDDGPYGPEWHIVSGGGAMSAVAVTSAFGSVDLPTAIPGSGQSVPAGATGVQLNGSATGGAGAPYTFAWRIITDTTGGASLSDDDIADPTLDVGPQGGQVVLGLTVTDDDDVESSEATVTITVIGAGTSAVPISDEVVSGWDTEPDSASSVHEVLADPDLDVYAYYVEPDGTVFLEVGLSELAVVEAVESGFIRYRASFLNGESGEVVASLKVGASTTIATFDPDVWSVEELPQLFQHSLTPQQLATISGSDWQNLRLRFEGTVND